MQFRFLPVPESAPRERVAQHINRILRTLEQVLQGLNRNDLVLEYPYDIEVTDSDFGVILTSPDGSRWRVTVSNTGSLSTTAL